jgi:hypothetical protein
MMPSVATAVKNTIFDTLYSQFQARLNRQADDATEKTEDYAKKLESASGADMFKYLLLINVAAIEKYVAQTRIQAQISFRLCKRVALWSFVLIAAGVALAIYSTIWGNKELGAAKLSALSGVITQFIAGVFFYLYNRTLQQFNLFGEKVSSAQRVAISLLANAAIGDIGKRDASTVELIQALLGTPAAAPAAAQTPQP